MEKGKNWRKEKKQKNKIQGKKIGEKIKNSKTSDSHKEFHA